MKSCKMAKPFRVTQWCAAYTRNRHFVYHYGGSGALAVHNKGQGLETHLKKAGADCGEVAGTVTAKEADAVIATVSTLVSQATVALSSIVTKKPEFDAILLATALIRSDIKNLDTQTKTFDSCLFTKTPAFHLTTVSALVTQINSSSYSAKTVYDESTSWLNKLDSSFITHIPCIFL